jgi:serine/threonine protein kinase
MSAQITEPDDDTDHSTTLTQHGHAKLLNLDTSNIAVGRRLGIGGSGCAVYACNVDGWQCAMKELIVENSKQSDIDQFLAEVFLLESLPPHKNLVRFLFHHKGHASIRIFMCRYEITLDSFLKERRQRDEFFEQGEVARLALDIVRALEILHDYKIIHRDVKSENLFVNHDMAGNVSHLTLSDFDSAKVLEKAGTANTITGTVGWMPPEVFSSAGKSYSFSADVWSFGMVMFELMDLGRPFHDVDEFDRNMYIEEGNLPRFRHPEAMDKKFSGVLPLWKKCCSLKPEDRPTLREIKMDLSSFL